MAGAGPLTPEIVPAWPPLLCTFTVPEPPPESNVIDWPAVITKFAGEGGGGGGGLWRGVGRGVRVLVGVGEAEVGVAVGVAVRVGVGRVVVRGLVASVFGSSGLGERVSVIARLLFLWPPIFQAA